VNPLIPASGPHGGDGARVAAALGRDVLDLSVSLNPVAADVTEVLVRHLDAARDYPDPTDATCALADAIGTSSDRVLLTNGGAEAIALVAAELGGTVSEPEFSLLPRTNGPTWCSNPNNPTGRLAAPDAQADVWDEAFYPLASGAWTRADGGAVVVGSLTKLFACPGLRVGYVLADDVGRFARRQPEWSVNSLAAAVIPELLEGADLPGWAKTVADLRADLTRLLVGFDPQPSDANWVLCARAPRLRERLAPLGVVVRDCDSFGLPDHVRVAVPDDAGLARLEEALCRLGD
jgi:histidinol-phosphate/aromatic aminotransferase/cobyric acid decarboxylase-like protein